MYKHIEKLIEATNGIDVSYRLAFNSSGSPDIGVRGAIDGDMKRDTIIIDDIPWLICGDIINATTNDRIASIQEMKLHKPSSIYIDLMAQSLITGKIVQVHLGRKNAISINMVAVGGIIRLSDDTKITRISGTIKLSKE